MHGTGRLCGRALRRRKPRMCVRRKEERDKALIACISPTVSLSAVPLPLILLVTMGWPPRTVDMSTAIMQCMQINRPDPVYVRPPPETAAPPEPLWLLAKCAYGVVDAPPMCYERVFALMRNLGAVRSPADPGLFVWLSSGLVILAVCVHVDDILFVGTVPGVAIFEEVLRASFSVRPVAVDLFVFTGLPITFSAKLGVRPAGIHDYKQA